MGEARGLIKNVRHLIDGLAPRVSSRTAARDEIAKMRMDSRPSAWAHLSRDEVAKRALDLIYIPDVKQGGLGLCLAATFLRTWIGRDPLAFARFVRSLYFDGKASLASVSGFTPHEIKPSCWPWEIATYATARRPIGWS